MTRRIEALIQLCTFMDAPGHLTSTMDVGTGKRVIETTLNFMNQVKRGQEGSVSGEAGRSADDEEGEEGEGEEEGDGLRTRAAEGTVCLTLFRDAVQSQVDKTGLPGALIALCYPDRIARRKDRTSFVMSDGRTVGLRSSDSLSSSTSPYLSIAELTGKGGDEFSGRNDQVYIINTRCILCCIYSPIVINTVSPVRPPYMP